MKHASTRASQMARVLIFVSTLSGGCATDHAGDDGGRVAEAHQSVVMTTYKRTKWNNWREIYALSPPKATYVVQLTWKAWYNCYQTQKVMDLLPASDVTSSICAALGAQAQVLSGNVTVCVSTTTHQPTPV